MHCPKCRTPEIKKNGFRRQKQSYRCKSCGYQFGENPISHDYHPRS